MEFKTESSRPLEFNDLDIGDIFKQPNDDRVFIKVKITNPARYAAFCLKNGCECTFKANDPVVLMRPKEPIVFVDG